MSKYNIQCANIYLILVRISNISCLWYKTYIHVSNLVYATRLWDNLHQVQCKLKSQNVEKPSIKSLSE